MKNFITKFNGQQIVFVYPIILSSSIEDDTILVTFPDFPEQMTEANTYDEAIKVAREVLTLCIADNRDMKIDNPEPSKREDIMLNDGQRLVYVQLWASEINSVETVYTKKDVSIPTWLVVKSQELGIDFSETLTQALLEKLGLN